jgi:hypothetical protein
MNMKQIAVVFSTLMLLAALTTGCKKDADNTEGTPLPTTTAPDMQQEGIAEPPQAAKPAIPVPSHEAAGHADEQAEGDEAAAGHQEDDEELAE